MVRLELLKVDGTLVIEPSADDANLAYRQRPGLLVVAIGKPGQVAGKSTGQGNAVPHVDIHSAQTTPLLLDHLHGQGARRIAIVLGTEQRNSYAEASACCERFVSRRPRPGPRPKQSAACARFLHRRSGFGIGHLGFQRIEQHHAAALHGQALDDGRRGGRCDFDGMARESRINDGAYAQHRRRQYPGMAHALTERHQGLASGGTTVLPACAATGWQPGRSPGRGRRRRRRSPVWQR